MQKAKKYDWKDSNMEKVGSKEDRAVKKESAETEPAWKKAKVCTSPNIFIWRIQKFKVVEWPKEDYGQFYDGDSYIVLNIYKEGGNDELLYDVHFWIGKHSTQDEYGTAAYKTVELDTLLDDKPVQHREVQGHESPLFKSYFTSLTYLKGGCDSGFRHVETKEYKPRLFHCHGVGKKIVVQEVKATRNNLDSGDVFMLDTGSQIVQWIGKGANMNEKFKAAQYANQLISDRFGKAKLEVLEEGDSSSEHLFFKNLSDEPSKKSFKQEKTSSSHEKQLFRLSDASGKMSFENIASGKFNKSQLDEADVFIIDNGDTVYVYIGENASQDERSSAFAYAHDYLKKTEYPYIPVTVVGANSKGSAASSFKQVLNA